MDEPFLTGFAPVSDHNTHTLILGSMPGRDSLDQSRYYAHLRNAFWPIMDELFGASAELSYLNRLAVLLRNGVGIWDVIYKCQRKNSLDSAIVEQSIEVNDFSGFFKTHTKIRRVCFNGAKAEQSYKKYILPQVSSNTFELIRLPSTSPANARMNFAQKLDAWRVVCSHHP